MNEFWYGYVKSRYYETAKLCYMDTCFKSCFIVYIKTDDIYRHSRKC